MSPTLSAENEFNKSSVSHETFLLVVVAMIIGLMTAFFILPVWMPDLAASLGGESPKVYWYLSRASAFVSLSILWVSMALGLGLSNKLARLWPGAPAAFAIHEYVSLLGLAFALFHALILLGDRYINFTVLQIILPFSTVDYRSLWVGIGQVGFYVWLIVALSFYIRSKISHRTWRWIHYLSFLMYLMGIFHGLFSGTDTSASWAQWYYWMSGGSILFLFIYRIVNTIAETLARRALPATKVHYPAPRPTQSRG